MTLSMGHTPPGPPLPYFIASRPPTSSQARSTSSMSYFVWLALTQKRTRDEMSGVAG